MVHKHRAKLRPKKHLKYGANKRAEHKIKVCLKIMALNIMKHLSR